MYRGARRSCVVGLLIGSMLITGCSREFGGNTSPRHPVAPASLSDVVDKVDLISHDPCFTGDPNTVYPRCGGRYLTEVRNLGLSARDQAAPHPDHAERVGRAVATIQEDIAAFGRHGCDAGRSGPEQCAPVLAEINSRLGTIGVELRGMLAKHPR